MSEVWYFAVLGQSNAGAMFNELGDEVSGIDVFTAQLTALTGQANVVVKNYAKGGSFADGDLTSDPTLRWWSLSGGQPGQLTIDAVAGMQQDIASLQALHDTVRVAVIWGQGEADAKRIQDGSSTVAEYTTATLRVFEYVGAAMSQPLDVYIMETGNTTDPAATEGHALVRQAQRAMATNNERIDIGAVTSDLPLRDVVHLDNDSYEITGQRLAEYVAYDRGYVTALTGPRPDPEPDARTAPDDPSPANAAPSGIVLAGGVVLENSASGTVVGSFSAEDPNPGDTHSFALIDDAGGRFALSGNNLVVANGVRLDFEQAGIHTVVVRATDQTGLSLDTVFTIGVGNRAPERVIGTPGSDVIVGGFGADWFSGGGGADHLRGGIGNDVLKGGSGNDRLTGGRGRDVETGGSGKDLFIFDDRDTGASRKLADSILDFRGGLGDRLDLRLVDANAKARGDQKFAFIGEAEFTRAGQVRYEHTSRDTWVYLNTDADASAEATIRLNGVFDLHSKWFLL